LLHLLLHQGKDRHQPWHNLPGYARDLARLAASGARRAAAACPPHLAMWLRSSGPWMPRATLASAITWSAPGCHWLGGGSRCGWTVRSPTSCPAASWPVPLPARPARRQVPVARRAVEQHPPRLPDPLIVTRRVSVRGAIMIGGQKIRVGLAHARKTAEVRGEADTYLITVDPASPSPRRARLAATSGGTRHRITAVTA